MFKVILEKSEEQEIKLPTSAGSWKKEEFQKNIYFCFVDYAKASDCVDHNKNVENSSRGGNTRPPDLSLEKTVCRAGSNSWNWTWNRLVPNRKRSMSRLYIVTLLI